MNNNQPSPLCDNRESLITHWSLFIAENDLQRRDLETVNGVKLEHVEVEFFTFKVSTCVVVLHIGPAGETGKWNAALWIQSEIDGHEVMIKANPSFQDFTDLAIMCGIW